MPHIAAMHIQRNISIFDVWRMFTFGINTSSFVKPSNQLFVYEGCVTKFTFFSLLTWYFCRYCIFDSASIIHTAGFFSPFWVFYNHLYDDEYPHSESYLRIINWGFWWSQCNEIRFNCAWIFPQFPHHNCAY